MKNKIILIISLFITIVLCSSILIACKDENECENVLQFIGASIDENNKIEFSVEKDVKSVKLIDKITLKDGYTWKLYADKIGLLELPAKIAVNPIIGELLDGENEFCIIVNSDDGKETIVYELTIFRNHDVVVSYIYNGKVVKTDTAETNAEYSVSTKTDEDFFDDGFVFNGWLDNDGNRVTKFDVKKDDVTFTADLTAKTTAVALNTDGGELSVNATNIVYGQKPVLPVPTKTGCQFNGWWINGVCYTNEEGVGNFTYLGDYSQTLTATAHWSLVKYQLQIHSNDSELGTVSYPNSASHYYEDAVTIKAETVNSDSTTWLGWYDGDELVSSEQSYTFTMPAHDLNLQAKWVRYSANKYIRIANRKPLQIDDLIYVKPDTVIKLSAPNWNLEEYGIWLGWYANGKFFSHDYDCEYTTSYESVTFIGIYELLTIDSTTLATAYMLDKDGNYITTAKVGDNVTLKTVCTDSTVTFEGWIDETNTVLSNEQSYLFTIPDKSIDLRAVWSMYSFKLLSSDSVKRQFVVNEEETYSGENSAFYFAANSTVTVSLNEVFDCVIVGWYMDDHFICEGKSCSFAMPKKNFTLIFETVNLPKFTVDDNNAGQILFTKGMYETGQNADAYAIPKDGYSFIAWYKNGGFLTNSSRLLIQFENQECEYVAAFCPTPEGLKSFVFKQIDTNKYIITGIREPSAHIIIPDNVSEIADEAFRVTADGYSTGTINEITFSKSVKKLGDYAFLGTSIKRINYIGTLEDWCEIEINDYSYLNNDVTEFYVNNELITNLVIPEGVTEIKDYAFANLSVITSVTLPNSVRTIGKSAFTGCDNINSVTLNEGLQELNYDTFAYCYKLLTITLPSTLTKVDRHTFSNSYRLSEIIDKTPSALSEHIYLEDSTQVYSEGESHLKTVDDFVFFADDEREIYFLVNYIGQRDSIVLPQNIDGKQYKINQFAFFRIAYLTSITISDGVTDIDKSAFESCCNLSELIISDTVQTIDREAFAFCLALKNIDFVGLKSDWENISKSEIWHKHSYIEKITCSNGVIDLISDD